MALSMSVSAGKHNARHNTDLAYRAKLPNVDPKLSSLNFTIRDEPIGKAYDRIFGKSLSDYNAKQRAKGHSERCIADYHAKVEGAWSADSAKVDSHKKGRSNVPKPCYEYVLQLGDRDTFRKELDYETAKEIFEEAVSGIEEKTDGAIDWFQVVLHFDEPNGTPHMHMAGIPYATGCKRGLSTQVSMGGALKALGLERLPDLQNLMMGELELAASRNGVERDRMDCHRRHVDVSEWKQLQRDLSAASAQLEAKRSEVAELDSAISEKSAEVERLDQLIERRSRKLESLTKALAEIESRLDSLVSNIAEIAHAFALKIFDRPFQVLESVADNPVIDSRAFRAAVERARESLKPRDERKAVDAAARAVKAEMQRLAPELDGLAAEARDMKASERTLDTDRSRGGEQSRSETLGGDAIG